MQFFRVQIINQHYKTMIMLLTLISEFHKSCNVVHTHPYFQIIFFMKTIQASQVPGQVCQGQGRAQYSESVDRDAYRLSTNEILTLAAGVEPTPAARVELTPAARVELTPLRGVSQLLTEWNNLHWLFQTLKVQQITIIKLL